MKEIGCPKTNLDFINFDNSVDVDGNFIDSGDFVILLRRTAVRLNRITKAARPNKLIKTIRLNRTNRLAKDPSSDYQSPKK
ncbi:MAG: hypothetical protein GX879_00815 [Bacteroidales bacterium]|nr:hypothetical protein [Bacteroidales bacterium]